MTRYLGTLFPKPWPFNVWLRYIFWERKSSYVNMSCNLRRPCHHSAKFVGDRSSRRGDIKFLICVVTSCHNVMIAHLTLGWELLTLRNHWPSLTLAGLKEVETQTFYFFRRHHVTTWSNGHVIWGVGVSQPNISL